MILSEQTEEQKHMFLEKNIMNVLFTCHYFEAIF